MPGPGGSLPCTEPCMWLHTSTTHWSRVRGLSGVVRMAQCNEGKGAAQHCPPSVCTFCVQPRIPWRRLCVPPCVTPAGSGQHRHTDGSKTGRQLLQEGATISAVTRQYRGPGPNMALAAKLHRDWLQTVGGRAGSRLLCCLGSPSNPGPSRACAGQAVGHREWPKEGSQVAFPHLTSGPGEGLGDSCMVQGHRDIF